MHRLLTAYRSDCNILKIYTSGPVLSLADIFCKLTEIYICQHLQLSGHNMWNITFTTLICIAACLVLLFLPPWCLVWSAGRNTIIKLPLHVYVFIVKKNCKVVVTFTGSWDLLLVSGILLHYISSLVDSVLTDIMQVRWFITKQCDMHRAFRRGKKQLGNRIYCDEITFSLAI